MQRRVLGRMGMGGEKTCTGCPCQCKRRSLGPKRIRSLHLTIRTAHSYLYSSSTKNHVVYQWNLFLVHVIGGSDTLGVWVEERSGVDSKRSMSLATDVLFQPLTTAEKFAEYRQLRTKM